MQIWINHYDVSYTFSSFGECILNFNLECLVDLGQNLLNTNTSFWGLKRIIKSWNQKVKIWYQLPMWRASKHASFILLTLNLFYCMPFFKMLTLSLTHIYFVDYKFSKLERTLHVKHLCLQGHSIKHLSVSWKRTSVF